MFNSTRFWGGGEKSHFEYALNFKRRNYNVLVITSQDSPLHKKCLEHNIHVYALHIGNSSFLNPFKVERIRKVLVEHEIDTIFLNSSPDLKLGGFASKKASVENIVYMRALAVPIKNRLLNRYLLKKVATHIVANSNDTKRTVLEKLSKTLKDEDVHVIYRGINFEEWDSREITPTSWKTNDEVIIGNVGRLVPQKGQTFLIDLANKLRKKGLKFKLLIAGIGQEERKLKNLIAKNNLTQHVELIGFLSDVKSFLNSIDIFVFPSLWEGFGNAMVEAMLEQKPVVAFNLTSNPEIVVDESVGFLVDYPNIEEFSKHVYELSQSAALRKAIGEKASKLIRSKFDFDSIIDAWEKLLG